MRSLAGPLPNPPCEGVDTLSITLTFARLYSTYRQVTHALLTRLPLYLRTNWHPPYGFNLSIPSIARLACLIHAASVHSEPGSNSPKNLENLDEGSWIVLFVTLLLFLTNLDRKIRGRLAWLFNIKELMLASLPCFRNGKQKSAPNCRSAFEIY